MIELFIKEFIKELWSVLGILVVTAGLFFVKIIRDYLISLSKTLYRKLRNKSTFKESIGVIRYINDKLVELRTILQSDRAFINEFKNGDYFSAKNPVWRVFRTFEKCADGIIYHSSDIRGEQVSSMFDIVEPVIIGSVKNNGVDIRGVRIMDCSNCPHPCKDRNTVIYNVEEMQHTASKQMLLNHIVKISIQVNLIVRDNTVGILGLDFCDELSRSLITDDRWLQECCKTINQYADKIEYCLANPNKFKQ